MKILILGGMGSLGKELQEFLLKKEIDNFAPEHELVNVSNNSDVADCIYTYQPNWVINCSAVLTASCEEDPQHAFWVNSIGEFYVSSWSKFHRINTIFISTNYVFDGEQVRFYSTEDKPNPLNFYGRSKLVGELLTTVNPNHYIIRTSGLFGKYPTRGKKMNFVDMVINNVKNGKEMKVKDYEFISPTYNTDLVEAIWNNIITNPPIAGTYHIVNEGTYTWYTYAKEIEDSVLPSYPYHNFVKPMLESEAPKEGIIRPKCGMLKNSFDMPTVTNALRRYLKEKGEYGT